MSIADSHSLLWIASIAALTTGVGVAAGGHLVRHGLAQLNTPRTRVRLPSRLVCGAGAGAAAIAAYRAGSWWLLPALLNWALGLTAAACCDAMTKRIPTPLIRAASLTTAVLLLGGTAVTGRWRFAVSAVICAVIAATVFTLCWRFLGIGFGDVRLAELGGLGLVHPTEPAMTAALVVFGLLTVGQAVLALARGGNRHTAIPYGPAIAAAFLAAAVV